MTPRAYFKQYKYDERLISGAFYPRSALEVTRGDKVGVVLLNVGGPLKMAEIKPYLYRIFMDPVLFNRPVNPVLRHLMASFLSNIRARIVSRQYEAIGGRSPLYRFTKEQAVALEVVLNNQNRKDNVQYRCYVGMRYGSPSIEQVLKRVARDGIDKLVLLPLFPQYAKSTTGAILDYWQAVTTELSIDIPTRSSASLYKQSTYVQALSERIDEALQRFSTHERKSVHLLFCAHSIPNKDVEEYGDTYPEQIQATVDKVMAYRDEDRSFNVSYHAKPGLINWLTPFAKDTITSLGAEGVKHLLVVPVSFVSDHLETAYALDVQVRQIALESGIQQFEINAGLNCHPLFIKGLADATRDVLSISRSNSARRNSKISRSLTSDSV